MWKSIVSVVLGYIVMVIIVVISTSIAAVLLLDSPDQISTAYLIANLVLGFIAATAGGFVTSKIAPNNPTQHVYYLAALVIILGLLLLAEPQTGQPNWYPWAIMLAGAAGVLTGGWYYGQKSNLATK
jgi:heme A synthase